MYEAFAAGTIKKGKEWQLSWNVIDKKGGLL
jgi:hypothetical protein